MGGAAAAGQWSGILGGTLGGIGDIIQAQNYHRPRLPEATGYEKRLRDLAQSAYIGGGQQLLGGTAMYNQLAPILMGMLPGMKYVPGTVGGGGTDGTGAMGGGGGDGQTSPLGDYTASLQRLQENQARQQQRQDLRAQIKGMRKGPERHALKQQVKALNKTIKGMPKQGVLERQQFMAGTAVPQQLFDIRQNAAPDVMSGGASPLSSLASIQGMMDAAQGNEPDQNYLNIYRGALG